MSMSLEYLHLTQLAKAHGVHLLMPSDVVHQQVNNDSEYIII